MRWSWFWLVPIWAACGHDYEIRVEMQPVAGGLERRLTSTKIVDGKKKPVGLTRALGTSIADRYDVDPNASTAAEVFAQELPGELGGAGFYQRFESDLGSASFYSEHLAPLKEPWEAVERIEQASDAAANRLMGWLRFELADEPSFVERVDAIDRDLRRLLRNLGLVAAMPGTMGGGSGSAGHMVVAFQLAVDAGFLEPAELPRLFDADDKAATGFVLAHVRSLVAEYLSLPEDSSALDFLASYDSVVQAWDAWCASTGSKEEIEKDIKGFSVLLFDLNFFESTRRVALSLATETEPHETNGSWDASTGRVSWRAEHIGKDDYDPGFRYAWWSSPDQSAQRAHFGDVVLEKNSLAEYVLWRLGLHEDQAERWRAFLESLAPGQDLAERLKGFRFESESPDAQSPEEGAPRGARLLARALEGRE